MLLFFFLPSFAFLSGNYATSVLAQGGGPQPKITICHRTDAVTNPYVKETVDANSTDFQGHLDHTGPIFTTGMTHDNDWGDIIPNALNWNSWGQVIWNNNCNIPNKIDCQLSDWSQCSAICGGGTQTRTIIQEPQNGGLACGPLTQSCNTDPCPPAGQCPTACGYQGGTVPNGEGGLTECSPTAACTTSTPTPVPDNPPAPPGPPGPKVCDAKQPPAPLLLSVTRTSATTALLKWAPVTPSTYYVISYGTDPNNLQFGVPNTGNTDNFTVGALNPNLNYYFNLRAVNDCMPSDPSAILGTGGTVLGASTGQVLGASTDRLAATHSDFSTIRAFGGFAVFGLVFASGVQFLHGKEEK